MFDRQSCHGEVRVVGRIVYGNARPPSGLHFHQENFECQRLIVLLRWL
jgi:hypothetical protein